jgi:hypothetical protein
MRPVRAMAFSLVGGFAGLGVGFFIWGLGAHPVAVPVSVCTLSILAGTIAGFPKT